MKTDRKGGQKCQHRRHHHTVSENSLRAESFRHHSAEEWGDDITAEIRRQNHPLHFDRNVVRVVYLTRICMASITYIPFLSIMQVSAVKALNEVAFSDVSPPSPPPPPKKKILFGHIFLLFLSHGLSFALFFLHFSANVTKTIINQKELETYWIKLFFCRGPFFFLFFFFSLSLFLLLLLLLLLLLKQ